MTPPPTRPTEGQLIDNDDDAEESIEWPEIVEEEVRDRRAPVVPRKGNKLKSCKKQSLWKDIKGL